jgi:hypothetical protein
MIPTFSGFSGFFYVSRQFSLLGSIPAWHPSSRLSTVLFFTVFENCMDNWKLHGHVAALVSHQGDAATVSRDIPTSVTFSL